MRGISHPSSLWALSQFHWKEEECWKQLVSLYHHPPTQKSPQWPLRSQKWKAENSWTQWSPPNSKLTHAVNKLRAEMGTTFWILHSAVQKRIPEKKKKQKVSFAMKWKENSLAATASNAVEELPLLYPRLHFRQFVTCSQSQSKNIKWEIAAILRESTFHIICITVYCCKCSIVILLLVISNCA